MNDAKVDRLAALPLFSACRPDELRRIALLGPGDVFGEMAPLTGGLRTATVTALTPMRLVVIESRAFATMLESAPVVARRILSVLAERLERSQAAAG